MNNETKQQIFEQQVGRIFETMAGARPKGTLFDDIMLAIYRKQVLYFRLKLTAVISMVAAFGLSAVFWGKAALYELASSEAWVLVKMFFYDFKAVVSNWQAYSSYFVESLPVTSITWLMLGLFIALLAFKILIQEFAHRPHRLSH